MLVRYIPVMADDVAQVNVQDVPDAIREKVLSEASERDVSISSLVVEIVGRCHGLDIPASGQRLRRQANGELPSGKPPWVIRVPAVLAEALVAAVGDDRRVAKSRLILNCLAEHYGLPAESPLNRSLAQPRDGGGRYARRG